MKFGIRFSWNDAPTKKNKARQEEICANPTPRLGGCLRLQSKSQPSVMKHWISKNRFTRISQRRWGCTHQVTQQQPVITWEHPCGWWDAVGRCKWFRRKERVRNEERECRRPSLHLKFFVKHYEVWLSSYRNLGRVLDRINVTIEILWRQKATNTKAFPSLLTPKRPAQLAALVHSTSSRVSGQ